MDNPTIYDTLTDLIRQNGFISSSRLLTTAEETSICRWLAHEVKLRWPSLSASDRVDVVRQYYDEFGNLVRLPDLIINYVISPIYDEFSAEADQALPHQVKKRRYEPQLIQGGIIDHQRDINVRGKVWMNYIDGRLYVWPMFERVIDEMKD